MPVAAVGGGGGGTLTTIARIATTSAVNNNTINAPASINAGDLLVLFDSGRGSVGPTPAADVIPSGWTGIYTHITVVGASLGMRTRVSYKIADGSEDSSNIVGMSDLSISKVMIQYRGNIAITGVALSTPVTDGQAGDPAAQTVAVSGATQPVIAWANYVTDTTLSAAISGITASNTYSPVAQHTVKDFLTPASSFTVDMNDDGDGNMLSSFYAELS